MLLKYLHIHKNEEEIRNITFKKGVNLIVDTTTVDNLKDSGNNVGKTTVLKLVDYCLGAKAKSIYQDSEFKTDSKIKDFLETNNVVITLCLSESIETDDDDDIIIKRNFLARAKKLAEINGDNITDEKEYQKKLKLLLFNFRGDKPSFREIASRYIRSDASSMDNDKSLKTTSFSSSSVFG